VAENNHVLELLPAYALDALETEEIDRVEAHLEGCADCRDELGTYRLLGADLALAVSPRRPPADLRQRILRHAADTAATPVLGSSLISRGVGLKSLFSRLLPAWSVISLVLLLALALSNLSLRQQAEQAERAGVFYVIPMQPTEHAYGASGRPGDQ
jgi:anti-sigma factor RsiW